MYLLMALLGVLGIGFLSIFIESLKNVYTYLG